MKIRELYSDETKWTQGVAARDVNKMCVPSQSSLAASWCLLGAAWKSVGFDGTQYDVLVDRLIAAVGGDVSSWNDDPFRTFEEVKSLVERLDI